MFHMRHLLRKQAFVLITLAVIAADQISKLCIRTVMSYGQSIPEEGFFRITYSENEGGIFGLPLPSVFLIVLTFIVIASITFVYYRYPLSRKMFVTIALGFLMGGATGNLIDRLFVGDFGKVTDFIDIGAWPVFNLADSAVVVGIILILYYFLFIHKKGKAKACVGGTQD